MINIQTAVTNIKNNLYVRHPLFVSDHKYGGVC